MKAKRNRRPFEESAKEYAEYCNKDGYLPGRFVTPKGNPIGLWGQNIRHGRIKLNKERIDILNAIPFIWDIKAYRKEVKKKERALREAKARANKRKKRSFDEWLEIFDLWNQNGYTPVEFVTPKKERIGKWCSHIRSGMIKVTAEQKAKLDERNFHWKVTVEVWNYWKDKNFKKACVEKQKKM